tara:strand:- start:786 stop:977 length:192 start_codon:yes stop_codon:yes gene_type:complete
MTDITKYKSVAIKIETYQKARPMADKLYMSMGSYIRYLIDKDVESNFDEAILENGKDTHVRAD